MKSKQTPLAIISCDKEIIELALEQKQYRLIGSFDSNPNADGHGRPILGGDDMWPAIQKKYPGVRAVLSVDPTERKERIAHHYGLKSLTSLISKHAVISPTAKIGDANIIQRGVCVMASARIGFGCKINLNAVVHHDGVVGDFCTLAPGALLLGAVKIGKKVFVGAGAIVLPKVKVGDGATIGAGAVVTKDVAAGLTVAGVPARPMKPS